MWRLIPFLLLASCAAVGPDETGSADQRVVRTLDLALGPAAIVDPGQPAERPFARRETQGAISADGRWTLRTDVTHTRMRCATYETGIQLGRGPNGCTQVEWLTAVSFGTREVQCNSATRIHSGGGRLESPRTIVEVADCVRVVTRCTGPC